MRDISSVALHLAISALKPATTLPFILVKLLSAQTPLADGIAAFHRGDYATAPLSLRRSTMNPAPSYSSRSQKPPLAIAIAPLPVFPWHLPLVKIVAWPG